MRDGGSDAPTGPAELRDAERASFPRAHRALPAWALAARAPELVDARLYDDVIWILRRYHLRVTAARETGQPRPTGEWVAAFPVALSSNGDRSATARHDPGQHSGAAPSSHATREAQS